jgi:hypothetical protein
MKFFSDVSTFRTFLSKFKSVDEYLDQVEIVLNSEFKDDGLNKDFK